MTLICELFIQLDLVYVCEFIQCPSIYIVLIQLDIYVNYMWCNGFIFHCSVHPKSVYQKLIFHSCEILNFHFNELNTDYGIFLNLNRSKKIIIQGWVWIWLILLWIWLMNLNLAFKYISETNGLFIFFVSTNS